MTVWSMIMISDNIEMKQHNIWYIQHIMKEKSVVTEGFLLKNIISENENGFGDKLNDIVDKCNNTHHRTIKLRPIDVKWSRYVDLMLKVMIMIPNLNLVIM